MQRMDKFILSDSDSPDIFAIGCVSLAGAVRPGCSRSSVRSFVCSVSCSFQELDMSTEAFVRNESAREEHWLNLVESSLQLADKKYKRVCEKVALHGAAKSIDRITHILLLCSE